MTMLPTFRCARLSCTLSSASCARRWQKANHGQRVAHAEGDERVLYRSCQKCSVGEANAKQEAMC